MFFFLRWFEDTERMATIRTTDVIPVDLNCILCAVEFSLSFLMKDVLKDTQKSNLFLTKAKTRRDAIHDVMWDEKRSTWSDYLIKEQKLNENFYASAFFPLWMDNFDYTGSSLSGNATRKKLAFQAFSDLGLFSFLGGLPASLIESGQQWDFPNAWAPLQHVVVHGLDGNDRLTITTPARKRAAKVLAQKFLENAYLTWKETGFMFEKYNVTRLGKGDGGEYVTQTGFGWTNGVALDFLNKYGDDVESPYFSPAVSSSSGLLFQQRQGPQLELFVCFLSYMTLILLFVYF